MTENKKMLFKLGEIGEILGAKTEGAPGLRRLSVSGIKIDSRKVTEGDLFVAVAGANHDGHDFVGSAFDNGALASVVSRKFARPGRLRGKTLFMVDDTVYALGEIARNYRNRMPAAVIAVTGSNGKTTVKNIIYEILSKTASAIKSRGNFNNLFGLPLSVFELRRDTEYAVFELGMSRTGEIARLGEIASPELAVITNVGPVHLEFFRDLKEIASAKLEIVDRIKSGGALIVNGDDENLRNIDAGDNLELIKFGLSPENDVYPVNLRFDENQLPSFRINGTDFRLSVPGIHNVYNAVAAYSVAVAEGIHPTIAGDAINGYAAEGMRSQVLRKSGISFFVDCYNANPVSMKYAIDTLASMKCEGRRIAVLGDMLELGAATEKYHREIGRHAKEAGIDYVMAYGDISRRIVEGIGGRGKHFDDKMELLTALRDMVKSGDLVLFKGSRGMALEEIADRIMEEV